MKKIFPFSEIIRLETEMMKIFEEFFPVEKSNDIMNVTWVPNIDICEKNEELIIRAELPGVNKKDIKIFLTGNKLEISGVKRQPLKQDAKVWYLVVEREYGRFLRRIFLPVTVNPESVKTLFEDGILTIKFNKFPETKKGQVEIKID